MHIGITCSHFEAPTEEDNLWRLRRYQEAIQTAGATPEMLWIPRDEQFDAHAATIAQQMDGLLISGGADLPPAMYGEETLENAGVELIRLQRPLFEIPLAREFARRGKPILGICYGCQLLNVWRGGSLIQDIKTQWPDSIEHSGVRHGVHLPHGSRLSQIIGADEFIVESSHHQAISKIAPDAKLIATAPDGVAEAVEWPDGEWIFGVQWHPERDPQSLATQRLFEAFIGAGKS